MSANGFLVYLTNGSCQPEAQLWPELPEKGRNPDVDRRLLARFPIKEGEWDLSFDVLRRLYPLPKEEPK